LWSVLPPLEAWLRCQAQERGVNALEGLVYLGLILLGAFVVTAVLISMIDKGDDDGDA